MNSTVDAYVAARDGLKLPGQGKGWLDTLRERGAARFRETGFPTLRNENWRYTNIRPLLKQTFVAAPQRGDDQSYERAGETILPGMETYRLVFVDGHFAPSLSGQETLPQGLTAVSMATAVEQGLPGVEEWLGKCMPEDNAAFTALNTAYIEDGVYLKVAPEHKIERPVEILCYISDEGGQLVQPRNLLVADEHSAISLVERYVSHDGAVHLTNAVTEIVALDSSRVVHTRLQEEGDAAFHVGGVFARAEALSNVSLNNVALGGRIARTDVSVILSGERASCELNGVYAGNGRQHIDNFTQVDHKVPDCKSDEYYKGVLNDRARAVFHGRVIVRPDAQHTDAQQQNRNLLLSENAEVDTKPQLEIYADDVKCSHGATVGQLEEQSLFYLRSRGIDDVTARSLLTWAFAADVIGRMSTSGLQNYLDGVLGSKLFGVKQLEDLL